ncbi:MAG: hypothetical protein ACD_30C00054G0017 [uncultured bacterium]|uniref:ABC transporter, ATP-binding protein n=4 Tax=Candidatus Daviesiibacteriota TaxID=1752718 RepID=A0A0G0HUF8_9BACT|nr:MAG: hypothetical protein ACD_30C00054G0017 [uncultured bacterium]KKQ07531.1 MAG: ABC transporter, ATP-binding protein [Candidatus Daviesbacteria bacterium GW2011_GWB1_36_5]KKQ14841.1 MAG: ABC transporter, ATP-binding protein [Candidatus Daviesbacteria bacterium GW2011_GWA1_36_8]OGE16767.1 MAG: ABC transporter ATP-binding protein [Candidatus Daviesbacteria bacterium RIFCSPHIGHO2_01_FULL_36_37]OGE35286.1 MAG: ABC transporter ATP-binding protein [Candidatus Daviesbacteria bacterium RIFCSPHIGHO
MSAIISVKNLVKKYKNAQTNAVDNISFEVEEGEFFTFLGPNGAGKTTTISILTTTLSKTSGEVKITGFDTDRDSSKVRQNVGIIFQNPSLDTNLTAEENIRFHAILYGLYPFRPSYELMPQSYKKRVKELSEVIGLGNELFNTIKTFSGGMKRKLEIIRSLMHKPKVLFLDEPTIGLDPLSRKNLWEYLKTVRKQQNITIFLTTHYLEEAEEADTVCIISKGKIVSLGTPTQIKNTLIDEYILIDADNRNKLTKELESKKIKFTGNGPFKIDIENKNLQKLIQDIKTPLSMLKTHSPTLEEAYLEIIAERENNLSS